MKLSLQHVRCFTDTQVGRIAPLTILVGENSTGKSSFLALLRIAHQITRGHLPPSFNADPFRLGAYGQIAYRPPGGEAVPMFRLSLSVDIPVPGQSAWAEATFGFRFVNHEGSPHLVQYRFHCPGYTIEIPVPKAQHDENTVRIDFPSGSAAPLLSETIAQALMGALQGRPGRWSWDVPLFLPSWLAFSLENELARRPNRSQANATWHAEIRQLSGIAQTVWRHLRWQPYAIAPVRTKPARTYDPVASTPQAESTHIPLKLARIQTAHSDQWRQLRQGIAEFGDKAGLFAGLDVKTLGSEGDPFQIMAQIAGLSSNFIDVGYGVSQILPILVDLLDTQVDSPQLYLLQQPEIHLHPRAQAQLGSFLSQFVKQTEHRVVVETHSDHLVDRIRMSIRDTTLTPDDVSLLFFERSGASVQIHNLTLDDSGTVQDVPDSYRQFFLEEQLSLLGV